MGTAVAGLAWSILGARYVHDVRVRLIAVEDAWSISMRCHTSSTCFQYYELILDHSVPCPYNYQILMTSATCNRGRDNRASLCLSSLADLTHTFTSFPCFPPNNHHNHTSSRCTTFRQWHKRHCLDMISLSLLPLWDEFEDEARSCITFHSF